MLEMKRDFARLASSASRLAPCSSSSIERLELMSSMTAIAWVIAPDGA